MDCEKYRTPEIDHQVEPHDARNASADVRVSREVTVDLEGKTDGGKQEMAANISRWIVVNLIDEQPESIGDYQFLEIAP